ncbi:TPA: pyruvate synthase [Candidatus Falkowbacteria bacterium]|nr:MAG: Pyruvate ferredoxin/flavodoxin oxidoreductase, delta subunit [Candidatus Falkowbacteria bacterium GW2011_GWF2_43_32]HBA36628.1 pyruvate synthase [Candidatus Falkowbacteria bacterium]
MKKTNIKNSPIKTPAKKLAVVTAPNTSLKNKTGSWRTHRPVFDHSLCIGCSLCSKICPEGCIVMAKQKKYGQKIKPVVDYDYCKGCGLCAKECPVKAIKMEKDYE